MQINRVVLIPRAPLLALFRWYPNILLEFQFQYLHQRPELITVHAGNIGSALCSLSVLISFSRSLRWFMRCRRAVDHARSLSLQLNSQHSPGYFQTKGVVHCQT